MLKYQKTAAPRTHVTEYMEQNDSSNPRACHSAYPEIAHSSYPENPQSFLPLPTQETDKNP